MAQTVSDYLFERMLEWGVKRIYGYPGDGINGLMAAFDKYSDRMQLVQVRHEEMAAFMATAHAKFTGEVGVCMATSGPGAIHLLNGLYDGKMDHMPVVAIVGQAATTGLGGSYQQEVDLQTLFKDVASEYCMTVSSPAAMRHVIDRAMRIAMATRSVTAVIIPKDIQEKDAVPEPPQKQNYVHSGVGYAAPRIIPKDVDLRRAADVLNAGTRVAMLVGAGAMNATDEVIAIANKLQACCAKALLGKAAVPDDIEWVTGDIGLLGTRPSSDMMRECDTLFMIGSTFPYDQFLPKQGQARGVQIDIDGKSLGLRYPMEVNLCGDAADTLRELLPLVAQKSDTSWRERLAKDRKEWQDVNASRAATTGKQINPEVVFTELATRLPERCIITGDAGTATNWLARHLQLRRGMKFSLSGSLATMGPAVPYAIAAKFAFPERVALALTGRWRDADERHQRDDHDQEVLEAVERSAPDHSGDEQSRPQPSDVGNAHRVGQPEIRRFARPAGFRLRAVRPDARTRRRARRTYRGPRRRLGPRTARRSAGDSRSDRRSEHLDHSAAHQLRAGAQHDVRAAQRRS